MKTAVKKMKQCSAPQSYQLACPVGMTREEKVQCDLCPGWELEALCRVCSSQKQHGNELRGRGLHLLRTKSGGTGAERDLVKKTLQWGL